MQSYFMYIYFLISEKNIFTYLLSVKYAEQMEFMFK